MTTLKIKLHNQSQEFTILDDALAIDFNTDEHKLAYKIPFEEIKNSTYTIRKKRDKNEALLYISVFFNVILILFIFSDELKIGLIYISYLLLPLTIILTLGLTIFNKGFEEKHIESDKILYFIFTKKNEIEIDRFISCIFEKRNAFFKNKYLIIDPVLPYHFQIDRILGLYTNKFITESEYEIIKEELDRYFNFKLNLNK
jgi:hypothetical protein